MKLLLPLFLLVSLGLAADPVPFHRGVNLTGWYQGGDAHQIPVGRYGAKDFENLKALGVDGVRLPVNFAGYVGPGPDYRLDPLALDLLDRGVDGLLKAGLAVVLDNHSDPTAPEVKGQLEGFERALWRQLSAHYGNRSSRLVYEIQNEPHEITPAEWARVQNLVLADLRALEPNRTVVVTGADWGGLAAMLLLPKLTDPHLIYTFHFYDPFVFTHQGAGWTDLKDLRGVSFPPGGEVPAGKDGWWVKQLKSYYQSDAPAVLRASLDQAAAFARDRGVSVWCGEFGVFNRYSDPADRATWYRTVRTALDERHIPWTMWDYQDSFGLFRPGSAEQFDRDLNQPVVEALGFTMPPQLPPGPVKVTKGFSLYTNPESDEPHDRLWLPPGSVDFFDTDRPGQGAYALRLKGLARYNAVAWSFAPVKDLSSLVAQGQLTFLLRANQPKFSFDLRFLDAAEGGRDRLPWRLTATVTQDQAPGDGQWHRVTIPLAKMVDTGAWDGSWHNATPGSFEWTRVGSFQIVAEQGDFGPLVLGFDDLKITAGGTEASAP